MDSTRLLFNHRYHIIIIIIIITGIINEQQIPSIFATRQLQIMVVLAHHEISEANDRSFFFSLFFSPSTITSHPKRRNRSAVCLPSQSLHFRNSVSSLSVRHTSIVGLHIYPHPELSFTRRTDWGNFFLVRFSHVFRVVDAHLRVRGV